MKNNKSNPSYEKIFDDLETIVQKTSHNVANRFQVKERGYIREGYYADLTVLDIDKPYTVSNDNILYKCGWSPFEGTNFSNIVQSTFINGQRVYHLGNFSETSPKMRLKFKR